MDAGQELSEREAWVFQAKLAEQAERYDEMADFMKKVALTDTELSTEERNLLSVAYKNVIGAKRASWRIISNVESKNKDNKKLVEKESQRFRELIETELTDQCTEIIALLDDHLIKSSKEHDSLVFLKKMKGDYYRYMSEYASGETRDIVVDNSKKAYEAAQEECVTGQLSATNPILLGLALNFSVFNYEILGNPKKACSIAKEAFDNAIHYLDQLSDDSYKDSTLIMQLLRDNLTLWTSDNDLGDKQPSESSGPSEEPEKPAE